MWEEEKAKGERSLRRKIRDALHGTSVTVVLIGAETASREWVQFEIVESWLKGNGLLGVRIHGIRDMRTKRTCRRGRNPFAGITVPDVDGEEVSLGNVVSLYDWVNDDGYRNFADWVEQAAAERGR